jgi:hypothetical protein
VRGVPRVLVSHVVLHGAKLRAAVREVVAAGMAKRVGMGSELGAGRGLPHYVLHGMATELIAVAQVSWTSARVARLSRACCRGLAQPLGGDAV